LKTTGVAAAGVGAATLGLGEVVKAQTPPETVSVYPTGHPTLYPTIPLPTPSDPEEEQFAFSRMYTIDSLEVEAAVNGGTPKSIWENNDNVIVLRSELLYDPEEDEEYWGPWEAYGDPIDYPQEMGTNRSAKNKFDYPNDSNGYPGGGTVKLMATATPNGPDYTAFNFGLVAYNPGDAYIASYVRMNQGVVVHGEPTYLTMFKDNDGNNIVESDRTVIYGGGAYNPNVTLVLGALNLTGPGHFEVNNLMCYKSGSSGIAGYSCNGARISNNIIEGLIPLVNVGEDYPLGQAINFSNRYYNNFDYEKTIGFIQGNIKIEANFVRPYSYPAISSAISISDIGIREVEGDPPSEPNPVSFVIKNNTTERVNGGIGCRGGHDRMSVLVEGNTCTVPDGGYGISFSGGKSDFTFDNGIVRNNNIHLIEGATAGCEISGEIEVGHTIENNTITGNGLYGIWVGGATQNVIRNNDLSQLEVYASQAYCSANNNSFRSNNFGPIHPDSEEETKAGLWITGSHITSTNDNFGSESYTYPGWYFDENTGTYGGVGCVLFDGSGTDNKVTALKNGVALHGDDVCNQVLNLPESFSTGPLLFFGPDDDIYIYIDWENDVIGFPVYDLPRLEFPDPNDPLTAYAYQRTEQWYFGIDLDEGFFGAPLPKLTTTILLTGQVYYNKLPIPTPTYILNFLGPTYYFDPPPVGEEPFDLKTNYAPGYEKCPMPDLGLMQAMPGKWKPAGAEPGGKAINLQELKAKLEKKLGRELPNFPTG
jgi:parallel beta-helix repeat protein